MPQSPDRSSAGYGSVFANRCFMVLLVAQLISYLGDRLDQFTLLELARARVDESAAGDVMTMMAIALLLPFVLFAPLVGPVVDRFSRKSVLVVTSACQCAIIAAVPFFRQFAFIQDNAIAAIFLVVFLIGAFTAFFTPAKTSFIAEIVERRALMAANSLTTFAGTIMNMLGALVAAGLLSLNEKGLVSLNVCFMIDAATYLVSGLMILSIVVPESPEARLLREQRRHASESFFTQIAKALKYLRVHRRTRHVVELAGCFGSLAGLTYALINTKTLDEMGAKTSSYGLLIGVFGLALIAGGLAMALGHRRLPSYEGFIASAFGLVAFSAWWLAVSPELTYARAGAEPLIIHTGIVPLIAIGMVGGALMVYITTMIQTSAPKRYHGRLFALENLIYNSMLLAGMGFWLVLSRWIASGVLSLATAGLAVALIAAAFSFAVLVVSRRHA